MKKPSYCPDWFEISNYEICSEYSRAAWFDALIARTILWKNFVNGWDPILSINDGKQLLELVSKKEGLAKSAQCNLIDEAPTSPEDIVRDMSLSNFFDCYQALKTKAPDLIDKIERRINDVNVANMERSVADRLKNGDWDWRSMRDIEHNNVPADNIMLKGDDLIGKSANGLIEVELYESDEKIIEAFKAWLSNKRKEQGHSKGRKTISDSEISKWHGLGILPYIDLMIWCKLNNKQFTFVEIGNLLYPNEFDVDLAERVRKVTAPKVEEMFRNSIISRI